MGATGRDEARDCQPLEGEAFYVMCRTHHRAVDECLAAVRAVPEPGEAPEAPADDPREALAREIVASCPGHYPRADNRGVCGACVDRITAALSEPLARPPVDAPTGDDSVVDEERLRAIAARVATLKQAWARAPFSFEWQNDVPYLLAVITTLRASLAARPDRGASQRVRHLEAALGRLMDYQITGAGEYGGDGYACDACGEEGKSPATIRHAPGCAWLQGHNALALATPEPQATPPTPERSAPPSGAPTGEDSAQHTNTRGA